MDAIAGATLNQITDIIVQVTDAMYQARVGAGATTQYVHNPYEAETNPGTTDELKMYLKSV